MADESKSFWASIPGALTGLAAVITAATGLYVATKPSAAPSQVTQSFSPPPASNTVTTASERKYHLIVASSPSRGDAVTQARKLRADGLPSEVILSTTGAYAVTLGSFASRDAASAALENAKQRGSAPADAYVLPPQRWKATVFP